MYKIFMIVGVIVMAVGWIAYGIWWVITERREKKQPRKTEHLRGVRKSFEDYAKKIEQYKLTPYKKTEDQRLKTKDDWPKAEGRGPKGKGSGGA